MTDVQENQERIAAPEFYEATEGDFAATPKRRVRTSVWMPAEAATIKKSVSPKSHNLSMQIGFLPLDAEGNAIKGASVSLDVYPNLINKQFAGHRRPDTFFGCYCLCRSIVDGFPKLPHKAGTTGMYELEDGSVVAAAEARRIRESIEIAVQKQMVEFYNKAEALVGKRCYIYVELRKNPNTGTEYITVTKTRGDRPADETVIEDGNVFEDESVA